VDHDQGPPLAGRLPVAGVDGCRAGWALAVLAPGADEPEVEVLGDLGPVVARLAAGELAHVAVDMPIGLPERGPRPCDLAARKLLGPRRSSVFPAPVRAVLGASTYPEALARSRAACGKGLSKQAFNLLRPIAEVEEAVRALGQDRLTETHPELAFIELTGGPLAWPKRHPEGAAARRRALLDALPRSGATLAARRPGCRADDVADACALAWSARRLERGEATILGGERDATGLRMEIAW
jgi:predicted RNase H-like nuclease